MTEDDASEPKTMSAGDRPAPLRSAARIAAVLVVVVLAFSAVAYGAKSLSYNGKTSQGRRISFKLGSGFLSGLQFHILDKCPRRWRLKVWDHDIPAIPVSHSRFSGHFSNKAGSTVRISGQIQGRTVTGTLHDRTKSKKIHRYCAGRATFKLRSR
jgi:hypothetical protein